jgi:hypothetical protein
MDLITFNVRLYGELSRYGKAIHQTGNYSTIDVQLPAGSVLKDLLDCLLLCTSERGFTFINEELSAMPNRQPDLDTVLKDGDRVLFFPLKMLPTHLHFDVKMTDQMTRTVRADEDLNLYYHYE